MTPWELLWEWLIKTYPVIMFIGAQLVFTVLIFYGAYRFVKWRYHKRIEDHLPEVARAHIKKLNSENRSLRRWIRKIERASDDMLGALNGILSLASGHYWRVPKMDEEGE